MRKMFALIAVATALLSASVALAQEPPGTEKIEAMNWVTGAWKGADKFYSPGQEAADSKSTMVAKYALQKRFIQMNWMYNVPGMGEFEGMLMLTHNEQANKYEGTWFDASSGQSTRATGDWKDNVLVLEGEKQPIMGMGEGQMFITLTKVSDTKFTLKVEITMDGSEKMTFLESTLTKG